LKTKGGFVMSVAVGGPVECCPWSVLVVRRVAKSSVVCILYIVSVCCRFGVESFLLCLCKW
jgi:hypothetical protein